ncbi:MAG: methyltransferase domain-containing protein [Candidatus Acidiferrales bacterium]
MKFAHSLPKAQFVGSRNESILRYCAGKTVLHLGFVDEGLLEDRLREQSWLHARLAQVARKLVGVDVSAQGVNRARELGYNDCYVGDVEKLSAVPFPRLDYDIILAPDIIEHLANPGLFLSELRQILTDSMVVLVTTPNALSIRTFFYPLSGTEVVHPDHNFYYSPTTLPTLLKKHGYKIEHLALYSSFWKPNFRNRRSITENFLKGIYLPMDITLRYLFIPFFPYFSDGMMLYAKKNSQGLA